MGVSVNPNRILSEAPILPTRQLSAFDFNLTPALKTQLAAQMVDWADNVVGLTKRGSKATFDDLVEYGKKLARDAGDDASSNEAKALYYLAMNSGRDNFMKLMQQLMSVNQASAKAAFVTQVNRVTSQTVRDNLVDLMDDVTSKNLSTMSKTEVDGLIDDMVALKQTIDNTADTVIGSSTKNSLSNIIDSQIKLLETATNINYSSRTRSLPSDIDTGTSPSPSPTTRDWALVEAGVLAATGKKIDFDANPEAKTFKDLYESGRMSENSAIDGMVSYIEKLKRNSTDTTLDDAQRKTALEKLDYIKETAKKIGGAAGDLLLGILTLGRKGVGNATGKKGVLAGLIVMAAAIGLAYGWDDLLYSIESFSESTHKACLRKITGYDNVVLDTEMFYGSVMQDFILSEYPEDKICEVPGKELTADQKIKAFTLQQKDDIYYVQVVYEDNCKDTIQLPDDSDGVPSFVSKRVCGGGTEEGGETETTEGGKTKEDFETWAKSNDGFGSDNVTSVSGPDSNGIFTVTDGAGDSYSYKWVDNKWKYQN